MTFFTECLDPVYSFVESLLSRSFSAFACSEIADEKQKRCSPWSLRETTLMFTSRKFKNCLVRYLQISYLTRKVRHIRLKYLAFQ